MDREQFLLRLMGIILASHFLLFILPHNLNISVGKLIGIWFVVSSFSGVLLFTRSKLSQFNLSDHPLEGLRTSKIRISQNCNLCGKPEVRPNLRFNGKYCSNNCARVAKRKVTAILSIVFYFIGISNLGSALFFAFPVAIGLFISAEIGYRKFNSEFLYRNIHPENEDENLEKKEDKIDTIFVDKLDENIRICCYQTARLAEKYCKCGRAINDELMNALV